MDAPEHTFVFADLAGFTALTDAHGDEAGASTAMRFHELTRAVLDGAQLVKTLGDGVMILAPSTEVAVHLVEQLTQSVAREPGFPSVRIGVHRGTAIERDGDYFGKSVNLTARVMEAARPGQALCTEPIAHAVTNARLAQAVPLGATRMKNIVEPVALYELVFQEPIAALRYLDPVCRMQVDASTATLEHQGTTFHFCSSACAEQFARTPDTYLRLLTDHSKTP